MKQFPLLFGALFTLFCSELAGQSRPNVILILADDVGISDIGPYGSEIETPNLDRLASEGLRFTQFYNMSKCESTRASLHTGLFAEKVNSVNAVSLGGLMREAGYYTAMVGKEHFGSWVPKHVLARNNFDDSLNYWAINQYFEPPDGKWQHPFELNGKEIAVSEMQYSQEPFYKTDALTDYALRFLQKGLDSETPFFLYLPYHVAHYPLQARPKDIAKYRGKYRAGWDVIRKARYERMKKIGVIPNNAALSPPEGNINKYRGPFRDQIYSYRPWNSISADEQDQLDLEMSVFAAMIDRLDQNIGRVLQAVKDAGADRNTMVMFLSDNGSCPYDSNRDFSIAAGGADSYRSLCAAWANVGNTPFRYFKQYGHEGGPHTHCIAYWPDVIEPGFAEQPAHVVDILPTLIEIAETDYPSFREGQPTPALDGHSLMPLFRGEDRPTPAILVSGFTERFRMVRMDNWKIVRVNAGPWELYNLANDPTELDNRASHDADQLTSMVARYRQWIAEQGAVLSRSKQVSLNGNP